MRNYSFLGMFKKYVDSSVILIFVTLLALIVANTELGDFYRQVWDWPVNFSIGGINLFSHSGRTLTLMEFINDFLMAIFFFSVGLEIKREILVGELSSIKKALLPIIGACGGMLVPVIVFLLVSPDNAEIHRGMAIPMATDIAFSLGVLSVFSKRVPVALKVFLATLAVADDLGGIIVIALCYSSNLQLQFLGYGAILITVLIIGNYLHVRSKMFYLSVGLLVWYTFLNSGIHATIAGVVVAFCVPARPRTTALAYVDSITDKIRRFPTTMKTKNGVSVLSNEQISMLKNLEHTSDRLISPLQSLEDALKNPINYFVIPLFAFANAGINLSGISIVNLFSGVGFAVFMGLAVGKILGVFSFSWLAIKLHWVNMPEGATWKAFFSVCALTGIGFTVSMFIADLSYRTIGAESAVLLNDAKLGILCGSITAALTGCFLLNKNLPKEE